MEHIILFCTGLIVFAIERVVTAVEESCGDPIPDDYRIVEEPPLHNIVMTEDGWKMIGYFSDE